MDKQKQWVTTETAARIKHYRHRRGISQEELALKANLNPAFLGQVERGLKCPTVDTLYKIASALNIPISELVRFDSFPVSDEENIERLKEIVARIPADKIDRAFQLIDAFVELL